MAPCSLKPGFNNHICLMNAYIQILVKDSTWSTSKGDTYYVLPTDTVLSLIDQYIERTGLNRHYRLKLANPLTKQLLFKDEQARFGDLGVADYDTLVILRPACC